MRITQNVTIYFVVLITVNFQVLFIYGVTEQMSESSPYFWILYEKIEAQRKSYNLQSPTASRW